MWAGRRVLVTGHTGFKGTWLVTLLDRLGAEVFGYSLGLDDSNKLYSETKTSNLLAGECFHDIRDYEKLWKYIEKVQPEFVIHMAAQSLVRKSFQEPMQTITTNVLGTSNLILAALNTDSVKFILNVTTDKVYKNDNLSRAFCETDNLGGDDIYSGSKAAVELIAHAINFSVNKKRIPIVNVRAGNVIGGGDWAEDRLIPDIVRSVTQLRKLGVRNPASTRPWQYVLDCLNGYLSLVQHKIANPDFILPNAMNFGPSDSLSVQEVVEIFSKRINVEIDASIAGEGVPEKKFLSLNSDLAEKIIGWKTVLTVNEAVDRTAAWYESYLSGVDSRQLVQNEIDWYLERIL
jgi:CDP-glucose 4,6-dehydratase